LLGLDIDQHASLPKPEQKKKEKNSLINNTIPPLIRSKRTNPFKPLLSASAIVPLDAHPLRHIGVRAPARPAWVRADVEADVGALGEDVCGGDFGREEGGGVRDGG